MTRKEQEKLGKEIVERLNKGEKVDNLDISSFYNIKQFYYIKIEEIDSNNSDLIILPEDNEGNSFLNVKFYVYLNRDFLNNIGIFSIENNSYFNFKTQKSHCFTKFKLTGNYWEVDYLDYWLISRDKRFKWIIEKLKKDNPEYNLAMYELYGFNEEYVRKELGYFKDICK